MGEGNFFLPSFHCGCLCLLQRRNGSNVAVKRCLSDKLAMVRMTDVYLLIEHLLVNVHPTIWHWRTHTQKNEHIQKTTI